MEMSEQLASSVPRNLLLHLAELDEECQNRLPSGTVDISRGPFTVFKASRGGYPSSTSGPSDLIETEHGSPRRQHLACSPPEGSDSIAGEDLIPIVDNSELDSLLDLTNLLDTATDTDATVRGYSDIFSNPEVQFRSIEKDFSRDGQFSEQVLSWPWLDRSSPSTVIISTPTIHGISAHEILFLLQHFSTTVLTYLTPVRHEKTPWHILFLPHMRNCLALLTLQQPIPHADMTTFQGLLAISALSMGGIHQSQMWLDQGQLFKQRAFQECGAMLTDAYDLPKRYKYKSVLMALQTAVLISTLGGDPVTEEYYFLETEKFIKLKGLGRKNSRKVRLLHRCYAFERLMYESTCMRGIDLKHRHRVCSDIKSVSIIPYPEDDMAFRLPTWHDLSEQISKILNLDDGETDMEDEVLGLWPDALCSKVSGVPEHWILLILHVVLLGKQKDAVEQGGSSNTTRLQEFLRRAKSLEGCINQHVLQPELSSLQGDQNSDMGSVLQIVLDTVRHALQIYFYRRIYEVEALWLQDKVVKVRDCLLRLEAGDTTSSGLSGCVGVLWASFIASCEAEDPSVQRSFSDWYRRAGKRTGMACWTNSLALSEQLWDEKRKLMGRKVTWIDLLRKHRQQVLQTCHVGA